MKCLLLIMLPVILLGGMSKEVEDTSTCVYVRVSKILKRCCDKLSAMLSSDSPEARGRRVMPLILSQFNEACMTCKSSLLKDAVLEVTDFCREEYAIEERFMSLEISHYLWKKANGGWEALSDSESSDPQAFRMCTLTNADPPIQHWVLIFFVRQECFRKVEGKYEMIQQKFLDYINDGHISGAKLKNSFLLSSFFTLCSARSSFFTLFFARDIEIITQL
ncbi:MAG: hypothetical protein OXC30_00230 [Alphaproteobacteria bacterium]|nr:hypothetical protein [Alphaproteobacteria bacterium]